MKKVLYQKQRQTLQYIHSCYKNQFRNKPISHNYLAVICFNPFIHKNFYCKSSVRLCSTYTFVIKVCIGKKNMTNNYLTVACLFLFVHKKILSQKQRQALQYIHFCNKTLVWKKYNKRIRNINPKRNTASVQNK
jgi:hypothetical protein